MQSPQNVYEVLNKTMHMKSLVRCLAHREISVCVNVDDNDDGDDENGGSGIIDVACVTQTWKLPQK